MTERETTSGDVDTRTTKPVYGDRGIGMPINKVGFPSREMRAARPMPIANEQLIRDLVSLVFHVQSQVYDVIEPSGRITAGEAINNIMDQTDGPQWRSIRTRLEALGLPHNWVEASSR